MLLLLLLRLLLWLQWLLLWLLWLLLLWLLWLLLLWLLWLFRLRSRIPYRIRCVRLGFLGLRCCCTAVAARLLRWLLELA